MFQHERQRPRDQVAEARAESRVVSATRDVRAEKEENDQALAAEVSEEELHQQRSELILVHGSDVNLQLTTRVSLQA